MVTEVPDVSAVVEINSYFAPADHSKPVLVELFATRLLDPERLEQSCAIVLDIFR